MRDIRKLFTEDESIVGQFPVPLANPGDLGDADSTPGSRSPGEGNGNPLQFLPGKSHGQKSLVGYS